MHSSTGQPLIPAKRHVSRRMYLWLTLALLLLLYVFILHFSAQAQAPSWISLATSGSIAFPRYDHSAVYDQTANTMIVFGGVIDVCCPSHPSNDVSVLSNANGMEGVSVWTQLNPSGSPPAGRSGHRAVYNSVTNRMIVFGGNDDADNMMNDVWILTGTNGRGGTPTWIPLNPLGVYLKTSARLSTMWAQANWSNARCVASFFSKRTRILRKRLNHE
jgi:hypothetical protein